MERYQVGKKHDGSYVVIDTWTDDEIGGWCSEDRDGAYDLAEELNN